MCEAGLLNIKVKEAGQEERNSMVREEAEAVEEKDHMHSPLSSGQGQRFALALYQYPISIRKQQKLNFKDGV